MYERGRMKYAELWRQTGVMVGMRDESGVMREETTRGERGGRGIECIRSGTREIK
jgi:hypothetical protein